MSSSRLHTQFEQLFEHFKGQNVSVQLDEITELLLCTRRNARIVLNKMEEEGWIEWRPSAGRGKLSDLIFKHNQDHVTEHLVHRYLNEDKVDQAFLVLDRDQLAFAHAVKNYLGIQPYGEGKILRLASCHSFSQLNPHQTSNTFEQHIIKHLFSGLTRLDAQQQLQPDLAHHWQALSSKHWRFYLRSNVRFHQGEGLTTAHVINSIEALRFLTPFAHIDRVCSPYHDVIDIYLNQTDYRLPWLLTETCAKISFHSSNNTALSGSNFQPIGTGPYQVVESHDTRLILKANPGYFGVNALIEYIEVWKIAPEYLSIVNHQLFNLERYQINSECVQQNNPTEASLFSLESIHLLLNRRNGIAANEQWAHYFTTQLNSLTVLNLLPEDAVVEYGILPAHGLKAGWRHRYHEDSFSNECVDTLLKPKTVKVITLAYSVVCPLSEMLSRMIVHYLNQDEITVTLMPYSSVNEELHLADLWLAPITLTSYDDHAWANWLLGHSCLEFFSQPDDFNAWQQLVYQWRSEKESSFPLHQLSRALVESGHIIPLCHRWRHANHDVLSMAMLSEQLHNINYHDSGWFDFQSLWFSPEE